MALMRKGQEYGDALFYAMTNRELGLFQGTGISPRYERFVCGACGVPANGRAVASLVRTSDLEVVWCVCPCDKHEPTVLVKQQEKVVSQVPIAKEFIQNNRWPSELGALYDEAAKSYAAGAFTACAMVCRKVLMATACHEGDSDGKKFAEYVNYITTTVIAFPRAQASIDRIRDIGNEANHNIEFVTQDDAKRAMQIVTYMLDTIYSLPAA
jgi:hypothetical protein